MVWLGFALLAPLMWAIGNVVDKYAISKWLKDPTVLLVFFGFAGFLAAVGIYIFKGFGAIPPIGIISALAAGAIYSFANLCYYRALQWEEVSRVIPIIYLDPLFTALFSAFFLKEIFSPLKYGAVLLIVLGSLLIAYRSGRGLSFSKGILLAFCGAFFYAVINTLYKFSLGYSDWWTIYSYVRFGAFAVSLPMAFRQRREIWRLVTIQSSGFVVVGVNSIIAQLGVIFFTVALSLGYATLTTSLSVLQPLFVLIFISLVSLVSGKVMAEELNKKIFIQKFCAILLMILGVFIIARS